MAEEITKTGTFDFGTFAKDLLTAGVAGYTAKQAATTAQANAEQVAFVNNDTRSAGYQDAGYEDYQAENKKTLLVLGGVAVAVILLGVLVFK